MNPLLTSPETTIPNTEPDNPPLEQPQPENQGVVEKLLTSLRNLQTKIGDKFKHLFRCESEDNPSDAPEAIPTHTPDNPEPQDRSPRRTLKRKHLKEGHGRALKTVAKNLAVRKIAKEIKEEDTGGQGQNHRNRIAIRSVAQTRFSEAFDVDAIRDEIENTEEVQSIDDEETRQAEVVRRVQKAQQTTFDTAIKDEIHRRAEEGDSWVTGQLKRGERHNKKQAEKLVPTLEFLRADIIDETIPDTPENEDRRWAAEIAYEEAENVARESTIEKLRRDASREYTRLSDTDKQHILTEALQRRSLAFIEGLPESDAVHHFRTNNTEFYKEVGRAYPGINTPQVRTEILVNNINEIIGGGPFSNDAWRAIVYNELVNAPDRAQPADTLKQVLENLLVSNACTPDNVAATLLYALAFYSETAQASDSNDFKQAHVLHSLVGDIADISDYNGLLDKLQSNGLLTDQQLLSNLRSLNIPGHTQQTAYCVNETLSYLRYLKDNNPAYNTYLQDAIANSLHPDYLKLFIAVDLMHDIANQEQAQRGMALSFDNKNRLVLNPNYLNNNMNHWVYNRFSNPTRNTGLRTEIQDTILRRQYGDNFQQEIPPDSRQYSLRSTVKRETPKQLREMAEHTEKGEIMKALMKELDMTREQAEQVYETSQTNLFKEFLKGSTKAGGRLIRGVATGIAFGLGITALGAISPGAASAATLFTTLYGAYNLVRFGVGLVSGSVAATTGVWRSRYDGSGVNYLGDKPWSPDGYSRTEVNRPPDAVGIVRRLFQRIGYSASCLWDPQFVAGGVGAAGGAGMAYLLGPASFLTTPFVLLGGRAAEAAAKRKHRNALRDVVERLRQNPGANMNAILSEISNDRSDAAQQLKRDLLGNVEGFRRAGRKWSNLVTGYMTGLAGGNLIMSVFDITPGITRLREKFASSTLDETTKAVSKEQQVPPDSKGAPDNKAVSKKQQAPPIHQQPTPQPEVNLTTAPQATVGHLVRRILDQNGVSMTEVPTSTLWHRLNWKKLATILNKTPEGRQLLTQLQIKPEATGTQIVQNLNTVSPSDILALQQSHVFANAVMDIYP